MKHCTRFFSYSRSCTNIVCQRNVLLRLLGFPSTQPLCTYVNWWNTERWKVCFSLLYIWGHCRSICFHSKACRRCATESKSRSKTSYCPFIQRIFPHRINFVVPTPACSIAGWRWRSRETEPKMCTEHTDCPVSLLDHSWEGSSTLHKLHLYICMVNGN